MEWSRRQFLLTTSLATVGGKGHKKVWSSQDPNTITIPPGATTGQRIIINSSGIAVYSSANNLVLDIVPGNTALIIGSQPSPQITLGTDPASNQALLTFLYNASDNKLNDGAYLQASVQNEATPNEIGFFQINGGQYNHQGSGSIQFKNSVGSIQIVMTSGASVAGAGTPTNASYCTVSQGTTSSNAALEADDPLGGAAASKALIQANWDHANGGGITLLAQNTISGKTATFQYNETGIKVSSNADQNLSYYAEFDIGNITLANSVFVTLIPVGVIQNQTDYAGTEMNLTTGVWTCPATGVWDFDLSFFLSAAYVSGSRLAAVIQAAGASSGGFDYTGQGRYQSCHATKRLNINDTVTFQLLQASGVSVTTVALDARNRIRIHLSH